MFLLTVIPFHEKHEHGWHTCNMSEPGGLLIHPSHSMQDYCKIEMYYMYDCQSHVVTCSIDYTNYVNMNLKNKQLFEGSSHPHLNA